ncbi:hypothetical protein VDG1235_3289 [Verrucomicrobiia bacterium DG1235]|nr:hypothetical protein VDG1235_3289 [Verrucomicrobiae bacterium DG1235]
MAGPNSITSFHYVYVLVSGDGKHRYVGTTQNLEQRLKKHNSGGVPHTSRHVPWTIETATAFRAKSKALAFEKYLKSGSGREFARRHF